MLIVVIIAGAVIMTIGGGLLFLSFKGFATAKRGDVRHIVYLVAAIAFVLFSCIAMLLWSLRFKS